MKKILSLVIRLFFAISSVALLVWLFRDTSPEQLLDTFASMNGAVWLMVIPVIFLNILLRAFRWRTTFGNHSGLRIGPLYESISIGYLLNNILPARAGDFARIYLFGKKTQIGKSQALATVMFERIVDLLFVCILLGVAGLMADLPAWLKNAGALVALGASGALALIFVLEVMGKGFISIVEKVLFFIPEKLLLFVIHVLKGFLEGVQGMRNVVGLIKFIVFTAVLLLSELLVIWIISEAFSMGLGIVETIVVMLFGVFAAMVPGLPGQVGVFEFAVVSGLGLMGVTGEIALVFAVGWHFSLIAMTSFLGVVSMIASGQSIAKIRNASTAG